jgi:DNA helicase-2/ATP-dependent DNA helicase PcrA
MGVAAVPGSGKTETLSRLAAAIINRGVLGSRQEVLIVTLVNSSVDNFYQRISRLVKEQGLLPHVGYRVRTLHGLAHDIVRERPALVGLSEKFEIVDERAAEEMLEEAALAWLRNHPFELEDYLSDEVEPGKLDWVRKGPLPELVKDTALAFTRLAKDRQLTPEMLAARLDGLVVPLPLAAMGTAIYADYQRALAYRGAVDFDDLIRLALRALMADEAFLARLRERWPVILEDEAQDSSHLQEEILRLLAGPTGNWVRVGDPNQAIYETFTTASPEFLRRFLVEAGVERRELPNSGRSTQSIVDLANFLVDWTIERHPEPAVRNALSRPHIELAPPGDPQPNPPDDPSKVVLYDRKLSPEAEMRAVVESLARWLPENPNSTVAVLAPRNQRGFDLVDVLRTRGLPVVDSLLRSTATTREAAGALAEILHYLSDPTSPVRLAKVFEVWQRDARADEELWPRIVAVGKVLRQCRHVETYLWPRAGQSWLEDVELPEDDRALLAEFRELARRWQGTVLLPIDQAVLTLAQDLFTAPGDLALAHKLAVSLRQAAEQHPTWRLPELTNELALIARNERRFLGFGDDDNGFDPDRYRGQVVVATMHKAKGLEWDRVYLMSVNNYDFPSGQPYDQYIAEKWFLRPSRHVQTGGSLNLAAESLAQLDLLAAGGDPGAYREGVATQQARLDYVRERLRLLYVGITRARKELVITWNSGHPAANRPELTPALPFVAMQTKVESGE